LLCTNANLACHPRLRGRLMSSSLRATGWRPSAADWGSGMSIVLRRGSTCPLGYRGQWMAAYRAAVPLAQANQLPLPRLWSVAVHESSHVRSAISSIQTFSFTFTAILNSQPLYNSGHLLSRTGTRRTWSTLNQSDLHPVVALRCQ